MTFDEFINSHDDYDQDKVDLLDMINFFFSSSSHYRPFNLNETIAEKMRVICGLHETNYFHWMPY